MHKKLLLMLTTIFFSTMIITGCNFDQNGPEDQNQMNEDIEETNFPNDGTDNNNLPGVDENDNMLRDDEKDRDPDQEDPIEDPRDMGDEDRRDE